MGHTLSSMSSESWPPQPTFAADDVPDLTDKVAIITGANSGVGKETAKVLLARNARVYVAARDPAKAERALRDLRALTGRDALFLRLDLADLRSVRAAAAEFLRKETELHVLFNNGGVMMPPLEQVTADGYDLQMGTNVLGHFYFTKLLLPTLISTARASPDRTARVVSAASVMHHLASGLDFNTFRDGPARKRASKSALYCQSKFGVVVFAVELARRYGDQGIVSISTNPGNLFSGLQRHLSRIEHFLMSLILYPTPYGALTQLWAGTCPEGAEFNGKYLAPWARVGTPQPATQDPDLGRQFWDWMEEQVKNV